MKIPTVSVIVPFFNVSSAIERCVCSLMEQTLHEGIEFIFINDASTDDSLLILNEVVARYPERSSQVHIISFSTHKGVAAARTLGIRRAKGDYLGWCDADDWVEPAMYESLLVATCSHQFDVVVSPHYVDTPTSTTIVSRIHRQQPYEHIRLLYQQPDTNLFLWDKLIRRAILIENYILPEPDINIGEDRSIVVKFFCSAKSLVTLSQPFYHHTVGFNASLTTSNNKSSHYRFEQDYKNTEAICHYLEHINNKDFQLTCQFFRFMTKWGYDRLLGQTRAYYDLYSITHSDIIRFVGLPLALRVKLSLIFSHYWIYRLYSIIKSL